MDTILPYYPYSKYLKSKYGEKVYKLPVNLPVSCPNRKEGQGCAYCSGLGTGFEAMDCMKSVSEQLEQTRAHIEDRYHAHKFIAYFQNYTNTYLPLDEFASYMEEAAKFPYIVELAVSTRPDCISREYLDVLKGLGRQYGRAVVIELGLQTVNYHTLCQMNRGHTLAEFIDAVLMVHNYGFELCAHVILNLPGDQLLDVIETAKVLSSLNIQTVKAHSLYIAKDSPLCEAYEKGSIGLCTKEEYLERLAVFLEYLDPDIAVERLFSRVPEKDSVFCNWGFSWWKLRDELLELMKAKQSYQGKRFQYLGGSALRRAGLL